jgi:hypothetical protein
MLKSLALAGAVLCALFSSNAEARQRHTIACVETGSVMRPVCDGKDNNPFSGARSIRVTMHRERHAANPRPRLGRETVSYEGRPAGCPHAWCGCWLASHLGISGRSLWLARNWARIGHSAGGPQVGAIAVWPHHVGQVRAVDGNRILLLSGNDGRAVRERWRTTAGIIAYRGI